ncbi:MAG: FAD-dependent oxidoreductase [Acidobacteriota bacterium]
MGSRYLVPFLLALCSALPAGAKKFDLVVYGGTAGGAITAVSAAREGLNVVVLEPGRHIGGMVTGGLSFTDFGNKAVIGGYSLEFFQRLGKYYGMPRFGNPVAWYFEPHVGEKILKEMLAEAKVTVLFGRRLREKDGVRKEGTRVVSITMENGESYEGRIFADASYEGDLMAQAKVSYTWGREGMEQYGESLAGVREQTPYHQFLVRVEAYGEDGKLLPEISAEPKGAVGAADRKVQAYNFRMCLSDDPANQVPFPKPANYDAKRYELLARLIEARTKAEGKPPRFNTLVKIDRIPNRKADINNLGAFSTDYIGKNWDYPDASYKRRAEIWQDHIAYTQGFFWFLGHDARVPESLRREVNTWGLAKDEFADTANWPHQLYVREARRMIGEYVVAQKDLQTDLTKSDPIGMGSYNSDSHNIQRVARADGSVENEGDVQVAVKPYQIPYRVMLPKRAEATNLLVPVCLSASHVAYSSVRMEPQYMIIGQAAGVAAKMAIAGDKDVQEIDTAALTETLRKQGAVMEIN